MKCISLFLGIAVALSARSAMANPYQSPQSDEEMLLGVVSDLREGNHRMQARCKRIESGARDVASRVPDMEATIRSAQDNTEAIGRYTSVGAGLEKAAWTVMDVVEGAATLGGIGTIIGGLGFGVHRFRNRRGRGQPPSASREGPPQPPPEPFNDQMRWPEPPSNEMPAALPTNNGSGSGRYGRTPGEFDRGNGQGHG